MANLLKSAYQANECPINEGYGYEDLDNKDFTDKYRKQEKLRDIRRRWNWVRRNSELFDYN